MKKTFFAMMAAIVMMACNSDELVNVAEHQNAITFDNTFVDSSTRASYDGSYTSATLGGFEVYATITGLNAEKEPVTANLFQGEEVVRGNSLGCGTGWSYRSGNTQYWIPGNTYHFRGIADGNVEGVSQVTTDKNGMCTAIRLLDASAQKDILLAEVTDRNYTYGDDTKVRFTFRHILSKVKFTFRNTVTTNNGYAYKVSNVVIHQVTKNASYDISDHSWQTVASHESYDCGFGNAVSESSPSGNGAEASVLPFQTSLQSNFERLLVPTKEPLRITFDCQLLKDGTPVNTQTGKEINTSVVELLSGHAYNFVISLGNPGEPIQFSVLQMKEWLPEKDDANLN